MQQAFTYLLTRSWKLSVASAMFFLTVEFPCVSLQKNDSDSVNIMRGSTNVNYRPTEMSIESDHSASISERSSDDT